MVESSGAVWTLKPFEMQQLDLISRIKHHPEEKQPKVGRTKDKLQIKAMDGVNIGHALSESQRFNSIMKQKRGLQG